MGEKLSFEESIQQTLESGINPLVMNVQPIYSCESKGEIAYRTELVFNSIVLGILKPDDYYIASMRAERGMIVADRSLMYTCRAIKERLAQGQEFDFISTRFPYSTFRQVDLADVLIKACDGDDEVLKHLCIEFPYNTLYHDKDAAVPVLSKLKQLKIKTMITDFGDTYCPVMRLADFPFSFVMMSPLATEQMRDPEKDGTINAIVTYIRSMGAKPIATGVESYEEIQAFERFGCYGFCKAEEPRPLFDYGGQVENG